MPFEKRIVENSRNPWYDKECRELKREYRRQSQREFALRKSLRKKPWVSRKERRYMAKLENDVRVAKNK